ncbi:MAG: FMN-binding protein [Planctomycetota bacterium]
MREKTYVIGFVVALCAVCAAAIAAARTAWWPRIEAMQTLDRKRAVLSLFGVIEPGGADAGEVLDRFRTRVEVDESGGMRLYSVQGPGGDRLGTAFEVHGKGRNGPVHGVLGVRPDGETIAGIRFYRHRETPGYGGRIATPWFSEKFAGKRLSGPDGTPGFEVSLSRGGPRTIDAITGATQTTYNVVDAVNRRIRRYMAGGRRLEEIELELPPNVAPSLGLNIDVPHLVKPSGKPRPPLMAPRGTRNVAAGAQVSASDTPIIGQLEQVTDGVKAAGFGNFVELMGGLQWVQIDLGGPCRIYAVLVWHEHSEPRVYRDVAVQLADDADFTRNVRAVFNNDRDNSAGLGAGEDMHYVDTYEGKLITVRGLKARYVRLYSAGNHREDVNRYIEVEVYGEPVKN